MAKAPKLSAKAKGKLPATPRRPSRPAKEKTPVAIEIQNSGPNLSLPGPSGTASAGPSTAPIPFGSVQPLMAAIVEQSQVGPNVQSVPPSHEPATTYTTAPITDDELTQDQRYAALWSMDKYKQLLDNLKLKKGVHVGNIKCHHCKVNKKGLPKEALEDADPYLCVCGCSTEKAVVEQYLVEKEILGFDVPNDLAETVLYRSITKEEWSRLDHIMGALFGYKTEWLLDPQAMKTGLLEAANKI